MTTTESWDKYIKPVPILQWLVVIVLSIHVLISGQDPLGMGTSAIYVLTLLSSNVLFLYVMPRLISLSNLTTILVVLDTLLVPATLYMTGSRGTDLYVVYFGIMLIAGAAGNLKRTLILAAMICAAYGVFTLWNDDDSTPLEAVLLRVPFFLVMTMFYGALAEYAQRIRTDREKMAYAATHDDLTGMPNRRLLLENLARELDRAKRFQRPVSCAMLDLDKFKSINDIYGHDMGDRVLQDFASLLALQSRGYDLIGRLGGDEFVWILPDVTKDSSLAPAEAIRETVEQYVFGGGTTTFRLSASIGVTTYMPGESPAPTPADMLKSADVALYMAKKHGGNQVCHLPLLAEALSPGVGAEPATGNR
jgi:diguanylate cyclase (GGDEF)-like protein